MFRRRRAQPGLATRDLRSSVEIEGFQRAVAAASTRDAAERIEAAWRARRAVPAPRHRLPDDDTIGGD